MAAATIVAVEEGAECLHQNPCLTMYLNDLFDFIRIYGVYRYSPRECLLQTQGVLHNTHVDIANECMGSQWAILNATHAIAQLSIVNKKQE